MSTEGFTPLREEDEVEVEDADADAGELSQSDLDSQVLLSKTLGGVEDEDADAYADELFKSDLDSQVLLSKKLSGKVHTVSWSGTKIACGDEAKFVTVLDVVSGKEWSKELGGKVRSVSWSADGTKIACGDGANFVTVLDAASEKEAWSKALGGMVYSVSWSADGTKIACGDGAKFVTVLDAASGEVTWSEALGGEVRSVSWSADGTKIACGDGAKFVTVLDAASGEVAWSKALGGMVYSVSWSMDGTKIACGDGAKSVTVLDAASGEVTWSEALGGMVYSVSWSADGTKIACGDEAKFVTVLDAASGKVAWSKALGGWVRSVSWSADGNKIACGDKAKSVTVLDVVSGEVAWSSKALGSEVRSVSWSAGGTKIACGDGANFVTVLDDAASGEVAWSKALRGEVYSVSWSADGNKIACGDGAKSVTVLLDAASGKVAWSKALRGEVRSVSWSADGTKIACGDGANFVTVLDAASGEMTWSKALGGMVYSVSWSADGTKIVCGYGAKFVTVLDVASGDVAWSKALGGEVRSVSWSPLTVRCNPASSSPADRLMRGSSRCCETESWVALCESAAATASSAPTLAARGTKIACGDKANSLTVLDAESGEVAWSKALGGWVRSVSWSADGTKIACGDGAMSVTVLDAASGEVAWSKVLGGGVYSVSWSMDGNKIACGVDANSVDANSVTVVKLHQPWFLASRSLHNLAELPTLLASPQGLRGRMTNGRTIASHLIAAKDPRCIEWLPALDASAAALFAPTILWRDVTRHHMLDRALATRQTKVLKLLLQHVFQSIPPEARDPLLDSPRGQYKSFLCELARTFPAILGAVLEDRGLDEYGANKSNAPQVGFASPAELSAEPGRLGLAPWPTAHPDKDGKLYDALKAKAQAKAQAANAADGDEEVFEVDCRVAGVPGLVARPPMDPNAPDLFKILVESGDPSILRSEAMRVAIAFKWEAFGYEKWLRQVARMAVLVATYAAGLALALNPRSSLHAVAGVSLFAITCVMALWLGYEEMVQMKKATSGQKKKATSGLRKHLSDPWNCAEVLSIATILVVGTLLVVGLAAEERTQDAARTLGAVGMLLLLFPMMQMGRGDENFAFLVSMLERIIIDMRPFCLVLGLALGTTSFALRLLKHDDEGYNDPFTAAFTSYSMMAMGDFEQNSYNDSTLLATVFLYATFIVNIVFLNALIAIMGDTYDNVQETRLERSRLQRGKLLIEIQSLMMEKELDNPELFPKWVHAIVKRSEDKDKNAWAGRIHAVTKEVKASVAKLQEQSEAKFAQMHKHTEAKFAQLHKPQEKVLSIVEKLGAIVASLPEGQVPRYARAERYLQAPDAPSGQIGNAFAAMQSVLPMFSARKRAPDAAD
jgi:WD40 repeat protein